MYAIEQMVYDFEQCTPTANAREVVVDKQDGRILIVDDDADILTAGRLLLNRHYGQVVTCDSPERIEPLMAQHQFDAILLDMNFGPGESSGRQGFTWLARILELDPQAVVVMITAHGGVDVAVEAMKMGATDFIAKPWQNEKMVATLSASVKLRRSRSEAELLKQTNRALSEGVSTAKQPMLGDSPALREVLSLIERAAPTEANVLLLGENGTGKELAARALHQQSQRNDGVFITVDLGALTESLFESELFGHKKGAFTDAREHRIGLLQAASGGTLFLDEIGNLPLHLQAKLLTVLEQRKIYPVGSNEAVDIDIRVISATNLPRDRLGAEAHFRQDLLFRLNTVEITLPPLRHRPEDIPNIAEHYAALYARKYGRPLKKFSGAAMAAVCSYEWPGNIRALRHALERAVILSEGEQFEVEDFQLEAPPNQPGAIGMPARDTGARQHTAPLVASPEDLNLERLEKRAIQQALQEHRYNISHAARALGLTRAALYRRLEKYGL